MRDSAETGEMTAARDAGAGKSRAERTAGECLEAQPLLTEQTGSGLVSEESERNLTRRSSLADQTKERLREQQKQEEAGGLPQHPLVRPGERVDDLQRAGLRIIQDPGLFCFGMDAVLLASYVQMKKARRGLDLGTGNGIIPILLSDRTDCARLTGLEIQPASVDLALRSVALNGLGERIQIVSGDIREADRIFAAASFDFITCNPPYRPVGSGRITGNYAAAAPGAAVPDPRALASHGSSASGRQAAGRCEPVPDPRAIARHELLCTFDDVADAAAKLLRPGGHFYLVHRPMRLVQILSRLCASRLEPKRMRLVYPHADQAPNLVLLDCVRGGAPELRVEPPLIVYGEDGQYTRELREIYRS